VRLLAKDLEDERCVAIVRSGGLNTYLYLMQSGLNARDLIRLGNQPAMPHLWRCDFLEDFILSIFFSLLT
jgi:hypothetical protein